MSVSGRFKVTKVEGEAERFQMRKLRRSLMLAMGDDACDPRLADPLARAITMYIRDRRSSAPITTDHVFDCAQTVLTDTGLEDVSRRMRRYRRERHQRRSRLLVCDYNRPSQELYRWSKRRLVAALESQHRLRLSVARILANEVEQRMLAMDFKVVSTALITEVIRNELLAWGLVNDAHEARLTLDYGN